MAVRINSAVDFLDISGGLPSNSAFTIIGDAQVAVDLGASLQPILWGLDASVTDAFALYWDNAFGAAYLASYNAGALYSGLTLPSRPAVGAPFCFFMRGTGVGAGQLQGGWRYPGRPWVQAAVDTSADIAQISTYYFGGVLSTYYAAQRKQNIKMWSRALSDAELLKESNSATPLSLRGLHSYFPLSNRGDIIDRGPFGRSISVASGVTTEQLPYPRYAKSQRSPLYQLTEALPHVFYLRA